MKKYLCMAVMAVMLLALTGCSSPFTSKDSSKSSVKKTTTEATTEEQIKTDPDRFVCTINGDADTIVKEGDPYIESGCHIYDKEEGNITDQVETEGEVDTDTPGDYTITYTVTDEAGYTQTTTRNVKVVAKDDYKATDNGVAVMMLHWVYDEDDPPENINANWISTSKLAEYCQWLQEEEYYYPSYEELAVFIDGKISLPEKSVILTFDDGRSCFLKNGIPVLEKYKVPATSFLIGANDGEKKVEKYASEYVTFQSHSYNMHQGGGGNIGRDGIIYAMSKEEIEEDLQKCADITGNNEAFAYPYGDVTDDAREAIQANGILCAFTIHNGRVNVGDDKTQLTRIRVDGSYTMQQLRYITKNQ